ncbi:hypothetical protein [Stenotrophomonas maltophilia]|uniref:hypothetical protein n=1 Tax=Stenotrophomonas maltophilia TaxID=40324 RepID=UPI0012B1F3B3|nr:hypothetical protein [Stenotrophomonas maltophilia]
MSEHDCFVFPAAPHLPGPDLQALEKWMLQAGLLLPPVAAQVPFHALHVLSYVIAQGTGASGWLHDPAWRCAADVVASHIRSGNLPTGLQVDCHGSVEACVQHLRAHGIALDPALLFDNHAQCAWYSPRYRAGPGMRALYPDGDLDDLSIRLFQVHAEEPPFVVAGEGTVPPRVPGEHEDREDFPPFGNYADFIGAAYGDINVQWSPPGTDARYRILDLDWYAGLGIGWHFIQFEGGTGDDMVAFIQAISDQCGQRMQVAHRHL